jgi:hypothetical protein
MNERYLKTVLTVIAFALCWIAVQLTIGPARADVVAAGQGGGKVTIAGAMTADGAGHDVDSQLS